MDTRSESIDMTTSAFLAPLIAAYQTALAGLPVPQQVAVQCSIGIETSDTHERWQFDANGAQVTVRDVPTDDVDFLFKTTKARLEQFIQADGISFLLRPIGNGKVVAFSALRGTLRMVINEGDEYTIVFGGAAIPEAVMRMGQQDALGLLAGTLNAQAAVFSGRIRIDSGMSFLMSLERFL
jgi:hypothetical protein